MNVEVYRPQAQVTFFTEQGELVARATNEPQTSMDEDVIRIRTVRDMGADAPTFSVELTRRRAWHKWVTSNDLVIIKMCRPPEKLAPIFYGLVDDVRKSVSISADGTPTRSITITGRGVSKAFINFDVGVVPEAELQLTAVGWVESAGVILAGKKTSDILNTAWDKICTPHINYKWDNGKKLFDYIRKTVIDRPNMILLDSSALMYWQGSIWAFFRELVENPFYELYWEVIDGYPTMMARATPFNKDKWTKLTSFSISDNDVVADDVGRSDVETYSIFSVGAKTLYSPNDTYKTYGVLPYWYEPYSKKYGNRRLQVESAYTAAADSTITEAQTDVMRDLMKDLFNWNIKNNSMFNGSIVVRGEAGYKVGCRLQYNKSNEDDGVSREYYITSVSHDFENFGAFITQLGVTRGLPSSERFTAPWDKYKEYSGLGIVDYNPVAAKKALLGGDGVDSEVPGNIDSGKSYDVVQAAYDILNNGIGGVKVRYHFGGNDPFAGSLDCSAFTQYVYSTYAGVRLGRSTVDQVAKGKKVDEKDAKPGDLVFFSNTFTAAMARPYGVSHVGIYVGDGEFIGCQGDEGTGGVKKAEVHGPYWGDHFLMFRRVLEDNNTTNNNDTADTPSGKTKTYQATAYGATLLNGGAGAPYKTKIGTTPIEGRTVAVDPKQIPLYSKLKIECDAYPKINGEYIAEDIGGAIKGGRVDIFMNDVPPADAILARSRMLDFGRRDIKVTILRKGKG